MTFNEYFFIGIVGFVFYFKLRNRIIKLEVEFTDVKAKLNCQTAELEAIKKNKNPAVPIMVQPEEKLTTSNLTYVQPQEPGYSHKIISHVEPEYSNVKNNEHPKQAEQHFKMNSEPGPLNKLFSSVKDYFMSGNTLVKVGVVLIFFGVSFLLKFAIDSNLLPIELRLVGAAMLGLGILKLGWNLRTKTRDYGLVLQGGGIGVLILTTFVSLKSYGLISSELAFLLLVSFTAATAWLAVVQDSKNLAIFGLLGGFLAPVLASSGQGQHVVLFSYYTLLNLGVLYISWKKSWRELNVIGFIFTFAIGTVWGVLKYQPEFYISTQPFLLIFFIIYIIIPILFANKQEPELKGYVDGTIVFGNSIMTLALQLQLVKGTEYAGAFSALALAGFYIFLSRYLLKHKNNNYRLLAEAFIAMGIVFITIAIPLAFDGLKTSAIWAAEAAGIYWIGIKQNRQLARQFSVLLIFATSVAFFLGPMRGESSTIFLNTFFFSCVLMAAGFYIISYLSEKNNLNDKNLKEDNKISSITFIMGSLWWIFGGLYEVDRFTWGWPYWISRGIQYSELSAIPKELLLNVQLLYLAVGAYILFTIGQKINFNKLKYLAHGFVLCLVIFFLGSLSRYQHPFQNYGYISWLAAFIGYYYILYFNDKNFENSKKLSLRLGHAGALLVLVGVLVQELNWLVRIYIGDSSAWRFAAQAIAPTLAIWLISEKKELLKWPVLSNYETYMQFGLIPVVAMTWLWLMITNWASNGNAEPLPYIPLFNPLEIAHLWVLLMLTLWLRRMIGTGKISKQNGGVALGATYFVWLNGVLCRAIHHVIGVPFKFDSLFDSSVVQVAFSLYWTILGIALMIFANRKNLRWLWLTGTGLLAIVVVKMFLIDLSKSNTIERVVSFIGVGILFLVVGYFSPIPPKKVETNLDAK